MSASSQGRLLLAAAIHSEASAVPNDARLGAFERWDSLAHVRLILALESELGRELDADEIVAIETVGDIDALLIGSRHVGPR